MKKCPIIMLSKHLPQPTLKINFDNSSKVDTLSSNGYYSIDKKDNTIIRSEQHLRTMEIRISTNFYLSYVVELLVIARNFS